MDDKVIAFKEWIVQIIEFQNTSPHSTIISSPKKWIMARTEGLYASPYRSDCWWWN